MATEQINLKNSDADEVGNIIDLLAAEMQPRRRRVPEMASVEAINRVGELLRARTKRAPH